MDIEIIKKAIEGKVVERVSSYTYENGRQQYTLFFGKQRLLIDGSIPNSFAFSIEDNFEPNVKISRATLEA